MSVISRLVAVCLLPGSVQVFAAADTTPPTVVALAIVGPSPVNVVNPPAALQVKVDFTDDASGLLYIYANWRSPSGQQTMYRNEYSESPRTSGSIIVRSPMLTIYSEPGDWELNYLYLCDRKYNCVYLNATAIATLIGSPLTTVVNNRSPDTGLPSASNAKVVTATVSASAAAPRWRVAVRLDDDVSGVGVAYVCASSPSGTQTDCAYGSYSRGVTGNVVEYIENQLASGPVWEQGTWTITELTVTDLAGNSRRYTVGDGLGALFPNGRTFVMGP